MDSRIWRWILVFVVTVTLASQINFGRIPIDAWTVDAYELVEELQAGDAVAVVIEPRLAQFGIIEDAYTVIVKHLMTKDVRILFMGTVYVDTSPQVEILISNTGLDTQKTYGVDYVNFGYIAGGASTVKALVENVGDVMTSDVYGNSAADMEVMEGLEKGSDFALLVEGWSAARDYIAIWGPLSKQGVKFLCVPQSPYITQWKLGQVNGVVEAFYGAAQYEDLSGIEGSAIGLDTAFGFFQLTIVAAIVFGNIEYFLQKQRKSVTEEAK